LKNYKISAVSTNSETQAGMLLMSAFFSQARDEPQKQDNGNTPAPFCKR